MDQCDNCHFYRLRTYGQAQVGECRYSDPFMHGWPRVNPDDWCGKWAPIPVHEEEPS